MSCVSINQCSVLQNKYHNNPLCTKGTNIKHFTKVNECKTVFQSRIQLDICSVEYSWVNMNHPTLRHKFRHTFLNSQAFPVAALIQNYRHHIRPFCEHTHYSVAKPKKNPVGLVGDVIFLVLLSYSYTENRRLGFKGSSPRSKKSSDYK